MPVECPTCSKDDFESESGMKTHHSVVHGESIAGVECVCEECGNVFRGTKYNPSKYCSRECYYESLKLERGDCKWCGLEIAQERRHGVKFCSQKCRSSWASDKYNERVELECEICNETFEVKPACVENRVTCSKECHNEWRSKTFRGENHPNWKGGYKTYYGPSWESQREKRREKDGYECQRCGVEESNLRRELDVHHKTPFRNYGVENHKKANRIENLISLCESCHHQIEIWPVKPEVVV